MAINYAVYSIYIYFLILKILYNFYKICSCITRILHVLTRIISTFSENLKLFWFGNSFNYKPKINFNGFSHRLHFQYDHIEKYDWK